MKKYAYYHIYLTEEIGTWAMYILDNFKKMEDSGLVDKLENIYISVIGNENSIALSKHLTDCLSSKYIFTPFVNTFDNDRHLATYDQNSSKNVNENVTIKMLYDHACREDAFFLYNHSKAITTFEKLLRYGHVDQFINNFYWKEFLLWGVIDEWEKCVKALDVYYDVAGANFFNVPEPHYSGNIWWSKSSHLKKLPEPTNDDWWFSMKTNHWDKWFRDCDIRYKDEMWLCSIKDTKVFNLKDVENLVGTRNLGWRRTPKKLYA
jgi:hypothetical protein